MLVGVQTTGEGCEKAAFGLAQPCFEIVVFAVSDRSVKAQAAPRRPQRLVSLDLRKTGDICRVGCLNRFPPMLPVIRAAAVWIESRAR